MAKKIILGKRNTILDDEFSLKIDGINHLSELNLSTTIYEKEFLKLINEKKFEKCSDIISLIGRISKGRYSRLNELKVILAIESVLDKYGKGIKCFEDYLEIKKEINKIYFFESEIDILLNNKDFNKKVNYLKFIEKEISLKEIIDKTINDIDNIKVSISGIKEIEKLKKIDETISTEDIEELRNKYINKLEKFYEKLNFDNLNKDKINSFLGENFHKEFSNSKEIIVFFEHILKEKKSIEVIINELEKVYSFYKFNNCKSIEERVLSLYNNKNMEFIELPMINKMKIVENVLNKNKLEFNYNNFEEVFNKELNSVINMNREKAISLF